MTSVIFITFANEPAIPGRYEGIEHAAQRLTAQAESTGNFISQIVVGWNEIREFASAKNISIPMDISIYSFKPLLAKMAISGFFGHADFYFYADAGCEIVNNKFAKADLKKMTNNAKKWGLYVEGTRYKDVSWCTRELIEILNPPNSHLETGQVQATFFIISNGADKVNRVTSLIDEWMALALSNNGLYVGNVFDPKRQSEFFISPRHDQSILSLLLKKHHYRIFREKRRGFGKIAPTLRGSNTFLHTTRNRTGISNLPKQINSVNLGLLTLIIRPLLVLHDFLSDEFGIRKQYKEFNRSTIAERSVWQ